MNFKSIEWLIAWRYLRAKRADGGVSAIAIISLIGIALGVFAMIATFAVRQGFRGEYVKTILGNDGHLTLYPSVYVNVEGAPILGIPDYQAMVANVSEVEGVDRVVPLVTGEALGSFGPQLGPTLVVGIDPMDFRKIDTIINNDQSYGDPLAFEGDGIAVGAGFARQLGITIGDKVKLTTINAVPSPFGTFPREYAYDVVYIVSSGNDFIDDRRVFITIEAAQSYFNLEGFASSIDVMVEDPEHIEKYEGAIFDATNGEVITRSWKQKNAGFLNGLKTEDRLMFILTGILVLVSTFTIVAGLIMLVKNKTADIAILRTMGFTRQSITHIFFLSGVILGLVGTLLGVLLSALFSVFFQPIFRFINLLLGGRAEDVYALQIIPNLHAELTWPIVIWSAVFAMALSVVITYFPARSASKLDPAEALRHG